MLIQILSGLGLLISAYGLYVEKRKKKDATYAPVCDISETVSCTKALTSSFGKHFGMSNTYYGIFFYILMLVLGIYDLLILAFVFSIVAVMASLYLAYILYFRLKDLCLVCTMTYVVNVLLLGASLYGLAG